MGTSDDGFFHPYAPLDIHGRRLPHWQQTDALVFLTWRLADSVPGDLLRDWTLERERWLAAHPPPHDAETLAAYRTRFPERIERWLDAGHGACELRAPACRAVVEEALRHADGDTHELRAFVIMPNHVHLVARLRNGTRLEDRVRRWKSWTARGINTALRREGPLWQEGYWDRLVRDSEHLRRCVRYIESNPVRAKLPADAYTLWIRPPEAGGACPPL